MGDKSAVMFEVNLKVGHEEVSDACARVIASWYHNGQASLGYSFVSTGAIPEEPSDVWHDLTDNGKSYESADRDDREALNMLGTYLTNAGPRGPVDGWSNLWVPERVPESGVTDCACCGDHIMVADCRALNFCDACTEEGCTERDSECC